MQHFDLQVKFFADSEMSSSRSARQLNDTLGQKGYDSKVVANEITQDAGTIVGIILGSAALIEIARGIADCIRRYNVNDIEFVGTSRTVRISNVHRKDVSELLEQISKVVE